MKFFMMYTPDRKTAETPPSKEHMAAMGKLVEEETRSGVLVSTGGLMPVSRGGARVRCSGGEITVVDGPFSESKELIVGWAIVQVNSLEEAIEASRRFLKIAGDGESEIRQIPDF